MARKFRVQFAPFDKLAYHADFDNTDAVVTFLDHISRDPVWANVPYRIEEL